MLNLMNDVGAPGVVTVVNVMARQSTSMVMGQPVADIAVYGMAVGGLLAGHMNWGGKNAGFFKNIGVASAPLAFEKAYDALRGTGTQAMAGMTRRVSRYPAPQSETPFSNRLSAHLV